MGQSSVRPPRETPELGKQLLQHVNIQGSFEAKDEELARQTWKCYDQSKSGYLEAKEANRFFMDLIHVLTTRGSITAADGTSLKLRFKTAIQEKYGGKLKFSDFFGAKDSLVKSPTDHKNRRDHVVEIFGLTETSKYNGARGQHRGIDPETKRVQVKINLIPAGKSEIVLIKAENVRPALKRVYCFKITAIRGTSRAVSLSGARFYFQSWDQYLKNNLDNKMGKQRLPTLVQNPGGTCKKKGSLFQTHQLNSCFIHYCFHPKGPPWKDYTWHLTHQSTLIFTFPEKLGPLVSYNFITTSGSKWRDPVAWSLYELDNTHGGWKLLGDVKCSHPPLGRTASYPLVFVNTTTPTVATMNMNTVEKDGGGGDVRLPPTGLPDLSRQVSFEPLTDSTTWQMVQLQRQTSQERRKAGSEMVRVIASEEHLLFLHSNTEELYLPRCVPKEVMALKGEPLLLIAEYADLSITRWNAVKKGAAFYKEAKKICAAQKSSRNPTAPAPSETKKTEYNPAKDCDALTGQTDEKMAKLFRVSEKKMLKDDSSYAAASYLHLSLLLESIDLHLTHITGKPSAARLFRQKQHRERMERIERAKNEAEKKKGGTVDHPLEKQSTSEPEVIQVKIDFGNEQGGGTGYGGNARVDHNARKAIAQKKEQLANSDRVTSLLVACVTRLLVSIKTRDLTTEQHKSILLSSSLNALFAYYLRSSFMQIAERQAVYLGLLKGCEQVALGPGVQVLDKDQEKGSADVVQLLSSIKRQVSVYVTSDKDTTDQEMIETASFAAEVDRIISAVLVQWKAYVKTKKAAEPVDVSQEEGGDRKALAKRMEDIGVNMVDLMSSPVKHIFKDEAMRSNPLPKVIRRLTQEIGSMMTVLPYGVFLRVDNTRMDLMRACIMAPGDAPYENGVFFFDIWIPANYPQSPPKCKMITTNRGSVRFNPNLYSNGKVCLSLLGTWSGPGWDPTFSNILQVLLSIQSMILGAPEPIVNEPGWVKDKGKPRSKAYNTWLVTKTIQHAMYDHLYWIKICSDPEAMKQEKEELKNVKTDPGPPKEGKHTNVNGYKNTVNHPWKCQRDSKTMKWYFWNTKTGESTWKKPKITQMPKNGKPARSPVEGFAEVLRLHFWLKKDYLLKTQLPKWADEVKKTQPKSPYGGGMVAQQLATEAFDKVRKALEEMTKPEIEADDEDEDEDLSDQDDY